MNPTPPACLLLKRFNGDELYPINRAEWNVYRDQEYNIWNLWIRVDAGYAITQQEDTVTLNAQPNWEINWDCRSEVCPDLTAGFRIEIPKGYVGMTDIARLTCFYYCSHEDTDENTVEVVAVSGNKILLRLCGSTIDVNFYDDSKPRTKIVVEAWFSHNPEGRRTFS